MSPLIGANDVISQIITNRQAWITGANGSYKTSVAYRLAYDLVIKYNAVEYIYTNNKSSWGDDITKNVSCEVNGVIIIDEGGLYIKSKNDVEEFTALAMKLNAIYLVPSYRPPPKGMRNLTIFALPMLLESGLPLVAYKWEANNASRKQQGIFFFWNPQEIYGVYSRQDPGGVTIELLKNVNRITQNLYNSYGREKPTQAVDITWGELKEDIIEALETR